MHPRMPIRKARKSRIDTDLPLQFSRKPLALPAPLARTFLNESLGFTWPPPLRTAPSGLAHRDFRKELAFLSSNFVTRHSNTALIWNEAKVNSYSWNRTIRVSRLTQPR